MNGKKLGRVVWKQYRELRAFWLSMLVLAVLLQAFLLTLIPSDIAPAESGEVLVLASALVVAFYALGVGATSFAGARENDTWYLLRALPVRGRDLLLGTLGFGVLSSIVLMICLTMIAGVLWLVKASPPWQFDLSSELALQAGVASLELLAWGMLFSLLSARPLRAAIMAGLAAFLFLQVTAIVLGTLPRIVNVSLADHLRWLFVIVPWPDRLGLIAGLLIVDGLVARRWLCERRAAGRSVRAAESSERGRLQDDIRYPTWLRLFWQQFRASRRTLTYTGLIYVGAALFIYTIRPPDRWLQSLIIPLVLIGGQLGLSVFRDDQRRHQYRFLAQHGASGSAVWINRQIFWGSILLLVTLAIIWLGVFAIYLARVMHISYYVDPNASPNRAVPVFLFYCLFWECLAYSAGQYWSLRMRSVIVAGVLTLMTTGLLAFWTLIMLQLRVGMWAIIPVPLILFGASWRSANDWLVERTGWRVRRRAVAWLVVPGLVLCAAFAVFRWTEIPYVEPGSPPRVATPAERTGYTRAIALYREAAASISPFPDPEQGDWLVVAGIEHPDQCMLRGPLTDAELEWLNSNAHSLETAVEASRVREFIEPRNAIADRHADRGLGGLDFQGRSRMLKLLLVSARRLESGGKLDQALDRYFDILHVVRHARAGSADTANPNPLPGGWHAEATVLFRMTYWARLPGQTPERIRAALERLERLQQTLPLYNRRWAENRYYRALAFAAGEERSLQYMPIRALHVLHRWINLGMPWESARLVRLVNQETCLFQDDVRRILEMLQQNQPIGMLRNPHRVIATPTARALRYQKIWQWRYTTLAGEIWRMPTDKILDTIVHVETARRMSRIALALEAWRLTHHRWPPALDALALGSVKNNACDPETGLPFSYHLDKVPVRLQRLHIQPGHATLEDATWFIWSDQTPADRTPKIIVAVKPRSGP